jgi:hypothetical protein
VGKTPPQTPLTPVTFEVPGSSDPVTEEMAIRERLGYFLLVVKIDAKNIGFYAGAKQPEAGRNQTILYPNNRPRPEDLVAADVEVIHAFSTIAEGLGVNVGGFNTSAVELEELEPYYLFSRDSILQ